MNVINSNPHREAYKLFASEVGIDAKDYSVFQIEHEGDKLIITPGGPVKNFGSAPARLPGVLKDFVNRCIKEDREKRTAKMRLDITWPPEMTIEEFREMVRQIVQEALS
jgi:hypothetical protein